MKRKNNEDTFLTAYLDGELDAGQRLRVDSALLADTRLCDDLRGLTAVRDQVAGLARPASPVDVSASVVATIRRRRDAGPLGRVIGVTAASWSARAVALVSAAAALIAVASLGARVGEPDAWASRRPGASTTGPGRDRSTLVTTNGTRSDPARVAGDAARSADTARALAPTRDERRRDRDRQQFHAWLESPNLRKVLIVTDVLGGDTGRQVGDLIETTPRRSATYGRFTVSQGILIDPDHPGDATVFAVVMDDQELRQLRARLDEAFPKVVRESEPPPEVVTDLAEVGQLAIFPGTAINVADLKDPVEMRNTALKAEPRRGAVVSRLVPETPGVDPLRDSGSAGFLDAPPQEPDRAAAGPGGRDGPAGRGPSAPHPRPARQDASVVLVWVASGRRDGPGAR